MEKLLAQVKEFPRTRKTIIVLLFCGILGSLILMIPPIRMLFLLLAEKLLDRPLAQPELWLNRMFKLAGLFLAWNVLFIFLVLFVKKIRTIILASIFLCGVFLVIPYTQKLLVFIIEKIKGGYLGDTLYWDQIFFWKKTISIFGYCFIVISSLTFFFQNSTIVKLAKSCKMFFIELDGKCNIMGKLHNDSFSFKHIPANFQMGVIYTFCIGFFAHLYMMTNNLQNHDSILLEYFTGGWYLSTGRWFIFFPGRISSAFTTPCVKIIFALIYMALSAGILVNIFKITNKVLILCVAGLIAVFPSNAAQFTYLFLADAYMMAMLLSVVAIYVFIKYRYGFLFSAVLAAMSIAIYQAYFSFTTMLCILLLLQCIFDKTKTSIEVAQFLLKIIVMIILSLTIYLVVLKTILHITNVSMGSYQGGSSFGIKQFFNMQFLYDSITKCYTSFFADFTGNISGGTTTFGKTIVRILTGIFVLFSFYLFLTRQAYKSILKCILFVLCFISIPLVINFVYFISPVTGGHMLQKNAFVLIFIGNIIFINNIKPTLNLSKFILCAPVAITIIAIWFFYTVTNIAYFNVQQRYEKNYALTLRFIDRIEQLPQFTPNMPIIITGNLYTDYFPADNYTKSVLNYMVGANNNTLLIFGFDYTNFHSFFSEYFNFQVQYPTYEQKEIVKNSLEFKNMTNWPHKDSVKIIEGIIVIKLSD